MTYYQELGVDPGASAEEIRRAYRHQIKVFHPDLQHDDDMRVRAEAKVRRLNEIVEVLADPDQRRAYDYEILLEPRELRRENPAPPAYARTSVWIAFAGAILACLVWGSRPAEPPVSAEDGGRPYAPVNEARRHVAPASARNVSEPEQTERRSGDSESPGRAMAREEDSNSAPSAPSTSATRSRAVETPAPEPPSPAPAAPASAVSAVKATVNETPNPQRPAAVNPLEGTWLFQPSRTDPVEKKLYPPKYIELRIQAEAGTLFGRYRSSYEVHDQALSPNVNFNFQGPASGSRTRAAWTGPGGAHGSVEIELVNSMTLRVEWKTEETGPGLDLVAGTAVLVKRLEN